MAQTQTYPHYSDLMAYRPSYPDTTGWIMRHEAALRVPSGFEVGIVSMLRGWLRYADEHEQRFESNIGDDYILGEAWQRMGRQLRTLLDGECGRLDCGTLDHILCEALRRSGIEESDL